MVIKQRSPNYPGIDLVEAVETIKKLYPAVQRGEFTPADAAKPMGYNSVSGPVRRKMGALKQYGLIEQKRGDNAKLTNRALTLLLRNPASNEYRAALREAALDPTLFSELYEAGKHTAATDALKQYLIVERAFTDEGASSFIEVLRATLAFANLLESDKITRQEEGDKEDEEDGDGDHNPLRTEIDPPPGRTMKSINLPLSENAWATLQAPFPVTEQEWALMKAVLDAMKPGLVASVTEVSQPASKRAESMPESALRRNGLTVEAEQLLESVDKGGVPAFVTNDLERIATQHGISVEADTKPNEIIEKLRDLRA